MNNENILKPYQLERRIDKLKGELLGEIIEGSLWIGDNFYLEVESNVKEIRGNVYINISNIPSWMSRVSVFGNFRCHGQGLTTLEGSPHYVSGNFYCSGNKLTSLLGSPREIGGDFNCGGNKLTSLGGAPDKVGGNFLCHENDVEFTEGDIIEAVKNFKNKS